MGVYLEDTLISHGQQMEQIIEDVNEDMAIHLYFH